MGAGLVETAKTLWKFGGYESSDRGTPIVLVAQVINAALESRYSVLRMPGAVAGYQVTAGKTLYLTKVRYNATGAIAAWLVLSGTSDVGANSVAAPTGVKSENSVADGISSALDVLAANNPVEFDMYVAIAAGLIPHVRCMTAAVTLSVSVFGHEE
jgi:hypothetical protein